jgi:hypothetical protein
MVLYRIIRLYRDDIGYRDIIKEGLTLKEAKEHCKSEDTHGDGWFDGYEQE